MGWKVKDRGFGAQSKLVWHAKLDGKRLVLDPASPSEAGQSANPASQGRMGGTETMWARVGFFVTMRQKLRKLPVTFCFHGMYRP